MKAEAVRRQVKGILRYMSDIFRKRVGENGAELLYISALDDEFPVKTFFTTKNGGLSGGSYASLNMGAASGDDPETVARNRDMAFKAAGCEIQAVAYPTQVHKSDIVCIDRGMLDSGRDDRVAPSASEYVSKYRTLVFPDTDATVTNVPGVMLTSLHADCIPVWLYDSANHAAGVAHAGWRGTRADIAAKTLERMHSEFGTRPEDVTAVIGPGISMCCFEVGREVYESFAEMLPESVDEFSRDDGNGKFHMDLKGINRKLLERAGAGRIYVTDLCTCCSEDLFFSYRRDGGVTGRMCAGICLE